VPFEGREREMRHSIGFVRRKSSNLNKNDDSPPRAKFQHNSRVAQFYPEVHDTGQIRSEAIEKGNCIHTVLELADFFC